MCKGASKLSQLWNDKKLEGLYDLRHSHCFQRSEAEGSNIYLLWNLALYICIYRGLYGNWINEFAVQKEYENLAVLHMKSRLA